MAGNAIVGAEDDIVANIERDKAPRHAPRRTKQDRSPTIIVAKPQEH
jgi:hypothetical protein